MSYASIALIRPAIVNLLFKNSPAALFTFFTYSSTLRIREAFAEFCPKVIAEVNKSKKQIISFIKMFGVDRLFNKGKNHQIRIPGHYQDSGLQFQGNLSYFLPLAYYPAPLH